MQALRGIVVAPSLADAEKQEGCDGAKQEAAARPDEKEEEAGARPDEQQDPIMRLDSLLDNT